MNGSQRGRGQRENRKSQRRRQDNAFSAFTFALEMIENPSAVGERRESQHGGYNGIKVPGAHGQRKRTAPKRRNVKECGRDPVRKIIAANQCGPKNQNGEANSRYGSAHARNYTAESRARFPRNRGSLIGFALISSKCGVDFSSNPLAIC